MLRAKVQDNFRGLKNGSSMHNTTQVIIRLLMGLSGVRVEGVRLLIVVFEGLGLGLKVSTPVFRTRHARQLLDASGVICYKGLPDIRDHAGPYRHEAGARKRAS